MNNLTCSVLSVIVWCFQCVLAALGMPVFGVPIFFFFQCSNVLGVSACLHVWCCSGRLCVQCSSSQFTICLFEAFRIAVCSVCPCAPRCQSGVSVPLCRSSSPYTSASWPRSNRSASFGPWSRPAPRDVRHSLSITVSLCLLPN